MFFSPGIGYLRRKCFSHLELGISDDEWVRLVKTFGSIKGIRHFELKCAHGSRDFHPCQAVADAVNNTHSLLTLQVLVLRDPRHVDQSGIVALGDALRQHPALERFIWNDSSPPEAQQDTSLDPVLQALSACLHLKEASTIMTTCASADALRNLLHLPTVSYLHFQLVLNTEHWLAVADEIHQGRCALKILTLAVIQCESAEATEAIEAIASAIRRDRNLLGLRLQMENGFTDEAGMALAGALAVNKTLKKVILVDIVCTNRQVPNKATLGVRAYEAFSDMLRVNTSLNLELPPLVTSGGDEMLLQHFNQMRIELCLNKVGSGKLLASDQMMRAAWVDALRDLNAANTDDTPAFQASCLYSFLRLNLAACMLQLTVPLNSGL
jgi:hypothetical protein